MYVCMNTILCCGTHLPIHTLNCWAVKSVQGCFFLTGGVFGTFFLHYTFLICGSIMNAV